jgi:hypothetical protein
MKSLFQVIMFHENAIEAEVREWMNSFEADRYSAMAILLNLFLAACGAAETLTSDMAADFDAIDVVLTGILKNFDPVFDKLTLGRSKRLPPPSKSKGTSSSEIQKVYDIVFREINEQDSNA